MRRAFTVVELLVVIAIIGVLVAITLPAVQMARESARKTQCSSQLKQFAMAAIAHNTMFEHFPNAGGLDGQPRSLTSSGGPRRSVEQDWGVFYQILPYIEEQKIYDATTSAEVAQAKIKIYFCPTRRPPTTVSGSTANGLAATDLRGGVDYAGNGGTLGFNPNIMNGHTGVIIPRPAIGNELMTVTAIRDGQSNVLMFGERSYLVKPATLPPDEDNGYINGWSPDTIRWSAQGLPRGSPWLLSFEPRFGGAHSSVFGIALCDGSTRFLNYSVISDAAFMQLTHRSDGKNPQLQ